MRDEDGGSSPGADLLTKRWLGFLSFGNPTAELDLEQNQEPFDELSFSVEHDREAVLAGVQAHNKLLLAVAPPVDVEARLDHDGPAFQTRHALRIDTSGGFRQHCSPLGRVAALPLLLRLKVLEPGRLAVTLPKEDEVLLLHLLQGKVGQV